MDVINVFNFIGNNYNFKLIVLLKLHYSCVICLTAKGKCIAPSERYIFNNQRKCLPKFYITNVTFLVDKKNI